MTEVSARPALRVAVAAVLAVAVAAIAVFASSGIGRVTPTVSATAATSDPVILTVTFSRRPGARSVAHLRCRGSRAKADGFLRPVARRACAHARGVARLLTTGPDPHRACTEIFGGPERALVTGRIGDRRVRRSFKRTDGCEVADWRRAMPLLPRPS
jgi:hypothetical protein